MKKKVFFIALISILSLFLVVNKKTEAEEVTATSLINEYYNGGMYTKKTQMYLTAKTIGQLKEHFHVAATSDRTTYYEGDYLLMGDFDGGFDTVNSGYMTYEGNMYHFTYSGDLSNPIKSKSKVMDMSIAEYYVALDDMQGAKYFDQFEKVSDTKYVYTVPTLVDGVEEKLHEFLWFSAPGLEDSVFGGENSYNYFSPIGMSLVLEEKNHPCYGDYLSIRILLDITDAGKVRTEEEISSWAIDGTGARILPEGEELVLSEARVYKGLECFDETDYVTFTSKFTNDYIYRVGNQNPVNLGSLFDNDYTVSDNSRINVVVEPYNDESGATGTYSPSNSLSNWQNGTLQFEGTGLVNVSINGCELLLEVVDAKNATDATNATSNNVVLLNDCGFSSLEVSGGYTLYGNGFTMTCSSDSAALDTGYAFVKLENGTLDNVQIVCPNFDYAVLYSSNMTESGNRSQTTDKTRYYNVKSGVMVIGDSKILNSRISGARAAVNVAGGNVVIDNSSIELGAVASILVGSANSVTLRDVTLVQKPTASTYDPSKILMGFSVLFICDADGNTAPVTIEGTLVQNAWVDANDKQYVPSAGQSIISTVLGKTEYLHDVDGDGTNESLNLGFAYMPESLTSKVNATTITDNRTNKNAIPYDYAEVSIFNGKTYVYSYKNTNGTVDLFKNEAVYTPNTQGDIITVTYSDTKDGLEVGKSFGTDGWVYELNVDLDKVSGYKLDFNKLSMTVNGVTVTDFKVNGGSKPSSPVAVTAGGTNYTLTTTIDGKEYTANFKVTGTETTKESPSLVATNYEAGLCVASSAGGTWHGAAPALEGIQIKYWSVAKKQYITLNLSELTPTTAGKQNGTNNIWTYSPTNRDFTLTLTGGQVHSKNNVYAMPVVCNGKLYFVASSTNGLVNTGNDPRSITVSYTFKDNNNGDVLTFSHTWSVAENKDEQYKYSDFCNGTLTQLKSGSSSGDGCITPNTLVTLADGTQVRVDSLTGNEELLVWNLETGKLDSAPIMFVDSEVTTLNEVVYLHFSDRTKVGVIYEHGFWDYDLNKYVYLDNNASEYIGHWFAKQNGEQLEKVQLVDVEVAQELTSAWSPVTVGHLCYFVNGMLSMPGGVGGLFNIFDVDSETMTYDYEAMANDIEKYGLFTYEELNEICPLSEEMFVAAGGAYLKISIAKGNMTVEDLIYMINRYNIYI